MLAQKLTLELNESEALAVANRFGGSGGGGGGWAGAAVVFFERAWLDEWNFEVRRRRINDL